MSIKKLENTAILLLICGLVIFPVELQMKLMESVGAYDKINFLYLIGMGILLYVKYKQEDWDKMEVAAKIILVMCACLMYYANRKLKTQMTVTALCNLLLPAVLLVCGNNKTLSKQFGQYIMWGLHAFSLCLLVVAIINAYSTTEIVMWGGATANAAILLGIFMVNDAYFASIKEKYPRWFLFMVTLAGIYLCGNFVAATLLCVYACANVIASKEGKITNAILAAVSIALICVDKFGGYGKLEGIEFKRSQFLNYLERGKKQLRLIEGYGTGYLAKKKMTKFAMELKLPILKHAFEYGILFAVLLLVGMYVFVSVKMIKRKKFMCWLGFTAVFVMYNSYVAMAARVNYCFMWMCLFVFLLLKCSAEPDDAPETVKKND